MSLQQFRNWGTLKQIAFNYRPQRAPHIREGLGHAPGVDPGFLPGEGAKAMVTLYGMRMSVF